MNPTLRRTLGFLASDSVMIAALRLITPWRRTHSVLQVRTDNIGDFVLWLDGAAAVRAHFPGYRIVLVANQAVADLARRLPYWDEVIAVDMARLLRSRRYRWSIFARVAGVRAEIALQAVYSRVLLGGDALIRCSGARSRVGYLGDLSNMGPREQWLANRWYTRLIPAAPGTVMEYARNMQFLVAAGIAVPARSGVKAALATIAAASSAKVPATPYFLVFIGGTTPRRKWALENYARVADALHARSGWTAVIIGGADSKGDAQCLARLMVSHAAIDLTGATDLPDLTALIARCMILIGNESSAIHLAAAIGACAVCVLGGGQPGRFLPYPADFPGARPVIVTHPMACFGCNWHCVVSQVPDQTWPCIAAIAVDQVLAGIEQALGRSAARPGLEQAHQAAPPDPPCPVCGGVRAPAFRARLLGRHDVAYLHCPGCGLLQAETPWCLAEAYADAIADSDTGLVARNLLLSGRVAVLLYLYFDRRAACCDTAGGYGLLPRILRDWGFDFYWEDPYCRNLLAYGFEASSAPGQFVLITALEVLEHVHDPVAYLRELIERHGCRTLVLSTELYAGSTPPDATWAYYGFNSGQHISFYQWRTLQAIADRLGLHAATIEGLHVFTATPLKRVGVARLLLGPLLPFALWWVRRNMSSLTHSDHFRLVERTAAAAADSPPGTTASPRPTLERTDP